jgi:hypothetical protein
MHLQFQTKLKVKSLSCNSQVSISFQQIEVGLSFQVALDNNGKEIEGTSNQTANQV